MFSQILDMLTFSISTVVSWFEDILIKTGGLTFYLVMIFIVSVFRYLLDPILGSQNIHNGYEYSNYNKRYRSNIRKNNKSRGLSVGDK